MRACSLLMLFVTMLDRVQGLMNNGVWSCNKIYQKSTIAFKSTKFCEVHSDCDLPMFCCDGFFFNYCCYGGMPQRIRKALFPNTTDPMLVPN